jgi:hypothetical protein
MKQIAKYAAPALLAATLTVGIGVEGATAAEGEPCAKQAAKVAKAEDALARVTAVFERQADKAKKAKAKKAKKAQQLRLQKAEARLDACLAAQEPVEEPVEG